MIYLHRKTSNNCAWMSTNASWASCILPLCNVRFSKDRATSMSSVLQVTVSALSSSLPHCPYSRRLRPRQQFVALPDLADVGLELGHHVI